MGNAGHENGATAAILAGGRSRRLAGRDKSALRLGSRRIIDRQLAVLRRVAGHVLIVAPEEARFADLGVPIVTDERPGTGPLGALHAALRASPTSPTLVVACDLPFLEPALLEHVLELGRTFDVVVPRTSDGYQPLCASYARACIGPIERQLDAGALKVTGFYEEVEVREIGHGELAPFDPRGVLFHNVNTPEDYAWAQHWIDGGPRAS